MSTGYQNQVGPNVQGIGSIAIYTNGGSATVLYSPADETKSKALYGTNYSKPDKPLPVGEWITIPNVDNIYIDYEVKPGGDIKICWSIV
jgi:hypothetical protein